MKWPHILQKRVHDVDYVYDQAIVITDLHEAERIGMIEASDHPDKSNMVLVTMAETHAEDNDDDDEEISGQIWSKTDLLAYAVSLVRKLADTSDPKTLQTMLSDDVTCTTSPLHKKLKN